MKLPIQSATALITIAVGISSSTAHAQQAEPEKKAWETTAFAGLTMTRGNSHTVMSTIGIDTKRKWDDSDFSAGAASGYGKDHGDRNTDFVLAYAQYDHNLTERWYYGLRLDGAHDGIADLTYRVRISPLLGYYVVKKEKTKLAFEAGPSAIIERYDPSPSDPDPSTHSYIALRFAERFEHKLSDTTKIWQTAEYIPYLENWPEKYLINAEAGISTEITKQWDLQVVMTMNYDSDVPADKKYMDTRLIARTAYKF